MTLDLIVAYALERKNRLLTSEGALEKLLDAVGRDPTEHLSVCHLDPAGAFITEVATVGAAPETAAQYADRDTWYGAGVLHPRVTAGRGTANDVIGVRELYVDLDVKAGGMPSLASAEAVIAVLSDMLGTSPGAVVMTGHGLQPHWALERDKDTDWPDQDDPRHAAAGALFRRFGRLAAHVAGQHGGAIDTVSDLSRVLRVPGTTNMKDPAVPVAVTMELASGGTVTLQRLLETLAEYGIPEVPEDTELLEGEVSAPATWTWAPSTCSYTAAMTGAWATDTPTARHPWLLAQSVRLACAHRLGCLTEPDYLAARAFLDGRFRALLDTGHPQRPEAHGEVAGATAWGITKAASFDDARAGKELGKHLHPVTEGEVAEGDPAADDAFEAALDFQRKVGDEASRLRVQDEARRVVRREQRGTSLQPRTPDLLSDFLAVPDPEQRDRIEGLLPIGARAVFASQFKAGKTTGIGNLTRSLADGTPFLGRFAVTPPAGRIVVLDTELDQRTLRRWLREQGIQQPDRVGVLSLRGNVGTLDLLDTDTRTQWAKRLREVHAEILVLDNLRPVLDTLGLSEDKDAGRFLVAFDELLAEAGVGEAFVVHHMGHNGERSRGDSRLRDWPDVEWRLVREKSEDGEIDPNARRYFSAFGRDVDVPESLLAFDPVTRHLTLAGGSRKDTANDAVIVDLVELLTREPGLSGRKIETAMQGIHGRDRIRAALRKATRSGQIDTSPGDRGSVFHFAPTPPVRECAGSAR